MQILKVQTWDQSPIIFTNLKIHRKDHESAASVDVLSDVLWSLEVSELSRLLNGDPKKVVIGFCHPGVSRGWYAFPPPEALLLPSLLSLTLRVGVLTVLRGALAPETFTAVVSAFVRTIF